MASSFVIPAASLAVLLLLFSPAPAVAGIVTDADGEELQNSRPYYFFPYDREPTVSGSGALSWTPNNSSFCPLFVKSKSDSDGTPASISTLIRPTFVPTSYPVFITFLDTNTPCSEQLRWSVNSGEVKDYQLYVTAGPSGSSVLGGFEIEEADTEENAFYIKFCPSDESSVECYGVGILENGFLGITPNKPVSFRFVKAFSDIRMPVDRA